MDSQEFLSYYHDCRMSVLPMLDSLIKNKEVSRNILYEVMASMISEYPDAHRDKRILTTFNLCRQRAVEYYKQNPPPGNAQFIRLVFPENWPDNWREPYGQFLQILNKAVNDLPENERAAFILFRLVEVDLTLACQLLDISPEEFNNLLSNADLYLAPHFSQFST